MAENFYYLEFGNNSAYRFNGPVMISYTHNKEVRINKKKFEEKNINWIPSKGVFRKVDMIYPDISLESKEDWINFIKRELKLGGSITVPNPDMFHTRTISLEELERKGL